MDIVKRLRAAAELDPWHHEVNEAADEIERLRIDLEIEEDRKVKAQLFRNDMLKEIEFIRKALVEAVAYVPRADWHYMTKETRAAIAKATGGE